MVGYNDQPAGIQLVFYVSALVLTAVGMYWAAHKKSGPRRIPDNG
jgi:hypothetical protein